MIPRFPRDMYVDVIVPIGSQMTSLALLRLQPPDFSSSWSSEVGIRSAPDRSEVELHV